MKTVLLAQRALETKREDHTHQRGEDHKPEVILQTIGGPTRLCWMMKGEIQYIVVEMQTLDHIQRTYQDGLYEQREEIS